MYKYFGSCACKKVNISISLPEPLANYSPRRCDCDFCTSRNIIYLSSPSGSLSIENKCKLFVQKQGSNQASFFTCFNCNEVVATVISDKTKMLGALNANLLFEQNSLQPVVVISPKKLSAEEKLRRWKSIWLDVVINDKNQLDKKSL